MDMRRTEKHVAKELRAQVEEAKTILESILQDYMKQLEVAPQVQEIIDNAMDARALVVNDVTSNYETHGFQIQGSSWSLHQRLTTPLPPGSYRVTIIVHELHKSR